MAAVSQHHLLKTRLPGPFAHAHHLPPSAKPQSGMQVSRQGFAVLLKVRHLPRMESLRPGPLRKQTQQVHPPSLSLNLLLLCKWN